MVYWTLKKQTIKFTKDFFDLSLREKLKLILTLPEEILNNPYSHNNIVFAILQHSPTESKKDRPILWERQISAKARQADEQEEMNAR